MMPDVTPEDLRFMEEAIALAKQAAQLGEDLLPVPGGGQANL